MTQIVFICFRILTRSNLIEDKKIWSKTLDWIKTVLAISSTRNPKSLHSFSLLYFLLQLKFVLSFNFYFILRRGNQCSLGRSPPVPAVGSPCGCSHYGPPAISQVWFRLPWRRSPSGDAEVSQILPAGVPPHWKVPRRKT